MNYKSYNLSFPYPARKFACAITCKWNLWYRLFLSEMEIVVDHVTTESS